MRLLIDAGNTRIKWAVAHSAVNHVIERGVIVDDWSALSSFIGEIESVWVSCVAGKVVLSDIEAKVQSLLGVGINVAKVASSAIGMTNNYADLVRLGVDRWLAALGARSIVSRGALIVIDAGTAITIDLVSAENSFEGGVILPGFETMHDSLLGRTAGIESDRQAVESVLGKNTRDCVNAGVQYGLIGAIERIVAEISAGISSDSLRLLIMGGDANVIVANSELEVELQLDMIFCGLMLLSNK